MDRDRVFLSVLSNYAVDDNRDCSLHAFQHRLSILMTMFLAFRCLWWTAFFVSSFLNTRKQAQTTGYAVILVGFVFQTIIATGNGALIDLLFADDVAWWVVLIRFLLQMYPPFNWANCFFDISSIAGKHYHYAKGSVSDGDYFGWENATQARNKTLQGTQVVIPPMLDSVYLLMANTLMYFALAWYFDSVISSDTNEIHSTRFSVSRLRTGGADPAESVP